MMEWGKGGGERRGREWGSHLGCDLCLGWRLGALIVVVEVGREDRYFRKSIEALDGVLIYIKLGG